MFLLTFDPDHHNLFKSREVAEQIAAYYPGAKYTIRDLDQEARDRKEMLGLLVDAYLSGGLIPSDERMRAIEALLKRLGRLP